MVSARAKRPSTVFGIKKLIIIYHYHQLILTSRGEFLIWGHLVRFWSELVRLWSDLDQIWSESDQIWPKSDKIWPNLTKIWPNLTNTSNPLFAECVPFHLLLRKSILQLTITWEQDIRLACFSWCAPQLSNVSGIRSWEVIIVQSCALRVHICSDRDPSLFECSPVLEITI